MSQSEQNLKQEQEQNQGQKQNENENTESDLLIPNEFKQICKDFLGDILNTFSEYKEAGKLNEDLCYIYNTNLDDIKDDNKHIINIFNHCKGILPERFFDILYKNTKIFSLENETRNADRFFTRYRLQNIMER